MYDAQKHEPVSKTRLIIGSTLVALACIATLITSGWKDPDALWRLFGK